MAGSLVRWLVVSTSPRSPPVFGLSAHESTQYRCFFPFLWPRIFGLQFSLSCFRETLCAPSGFPSVPSFPFRGRCRCRCCCCRCCCRCCVAIAVAVTILLGLSAAVEFRYAVIVLAIYNSHHVESFTLSYLLVTLLPQFDLAATLVVVLVVVVKAHVVLIFLLTCSAHLAAYLIRSLALACLPLLVNLHLLYIILIPSHDLRSQCIGFPDVLHALGPTFGTYSSPPMTHGL